MSDKCDRSGNFAARAGLSWMTRMAASENPSLTHARTLSFCNNHWSSGVMPMRQSHEFRAPDAVSLDSGTPALPFPWIRQGSNFRVPVHYQQRGLETIVDFKLVKDVSQMCFDGLLTN